MSQRHGPRSPGWQAFLRNHTAHIAGVDLFVVPTIGFKLLYGLVILGLERRRLVWTNVTANPTAEWIAQQISEGLCHGNSISHASKAKARHGFMPLRRHLATLQ